MTASHPYDPVLEGRGRDLSMPDIARWLPDAIRWRWPRFEMTYGAFESDWTGGVRTPGRRLGYLVANLLDSALQWLSGGVWRADLDDHDDPSHLFLFDATRFRSVPLRVSGTGRLRVAEFDGQLFQLRYGGDALVTALAAHCARFFVGPVEMVETDNLAPDLTPRAHRRGAARPLAQAGVAAPI